MRAMTEKTVSGEVAIDLIEAVEELARFLDFAIEACVAPQLGIDPAGALRDARITVATARAELAVER